MLFVLTLEYYKLLFVGFNNGTPLIEPDNFPTASNHTTSQKLKKAEMENSGRLSNIKH